MSESQSNSNQGGQGGQGGGPNNRRRRFRNNRGQGQGQGQGQNQNPNQNQGQAPQHSHSQGQGQGQGQNQGQSRGGGQGRNSQSQNRNPDQRYRESSSNSRSRRPGGRVLTSNQVLVKYDNLLEQHLITRRKYFEYFNRVDERQLYRLEKNFFDSIEHLRRFEASLEGWQRETLEKRKTERYRLDLTYSGNRNLDLSAPVEEVPPEEIEDPHYKESQKEAFQEYRDDTEESEGSFEDYLKLKGLN